MIKQPIQRGIYAFGGGGSGGVTTGAKIAVPALTANTPVTLTHNLNKSNIVLQVRDSENEVELETMKADPGDPNNKVILESAVNIPGGTLDVFIQGFN